MTPTINTIPTTYATKKTSERLIAETILANTRTVGEIRIGFLPLSVLCVDYSYQRYSRTKVKEIASNFDHNKCGFLLVSYRENESRFAIIDGGHRFEAATLIGLASLPCQILTGLSVEDEAKVFAAQNENRTRLSTVDLLKAQVRAGDEIAIGFHQMVKEFGIKLYNNGRDTQIGRMECVKTARHLYEEDPEALRWTFSMICKANWNAIRKGLTVFTIVPLYNLYRNHADDLKEIENRILPFMYRVSPQTMLTKAMSTFYGYTRAEAMTELLDAVGTSRLPALLD